MSVTESERTSGRAVTSESDPRFQIAAARRILHREGLDSQVGGHVSLRVPGEDVLDEPAAGLGAEDVDTLVDGLNGWLQAHPEAAVMIIEHDLELITRLCPRAAVLHFGRIIQAGAPKDVLRDPTVVEAYLGADVAAGD